MVDAVMLEWRPDQPDTQDVGACQTRPWWVEFSIGTLVLQGTKVDVPHGPVAPCDAIDILDSDLTLCEIARTTLQVKDWQGKWHSHVDFIHQSLYLILSKLNSHFFDYLITYSFNFHWLNHHNCFSKHVSFSSSSGYPRFCCWCFNCSSTSLNVIVFISSTVLSIHSIELHIAPSIHRLKFVMSKKVQTADDAIVRTGLHVGITELNMLCVK